MRRQSRGGKGIFGEDEVVKMKFYEDGFFDRIG
jgi:hypothetical protein